MANTLMRTFCLRNLVIKHYLRLPVSKRPKTMENEKIVKRSFVLINDERENNVNKAQIENKAADSCFEVSWDFFVGAHPKGKTSEFIATKVGVVPSDA